MFWFLLQCLTASPQNNPSSNDSPSIAEGFLEKFQSSVNFLIEPGEVVQESSNPQVYAPQVIVLGHPQSDMRSQLVKDFLEFDIEQYNVHESHTNEDFEKNIEKVEKLLSSSHPRLQKHKELLAFWIKSNRSVLEASKREHIARSSFSANIAKFLNEMTEEEINSLTEEELNEHFRKVAKELALL